MGKDKPNTLRARGSLLSEWCRSVGYDFEIPPEVRYPARSLHELWKKASLSPETTEEETKAKDIAFGILLKMMEKFFKEHS
jgi:hypothetical protein